MLQNATPLGKSPPWPLLCIAPATPNASYGSSSNVPPAIVFGNATNPSRFAHFWQGAQSFRETPSECAPYPSILFALLTSKRASRHTTACAFSTCQLPKVLRTWGVSYSLTWKCVSRHNGVHFFIISTSKSGLRPSVFLHFWLQSVLRATTACNCSSLIWKAGSTPAALASLLFDPPEPQIIGKTQCCATFLPFRAPASSFFWLCLFSDLLSTDSFSSLTLPTSAFHLSTLSEVWLLNFLRLVDYLINVVNWQTQFHQFYRQSLCWVGKSNNEHSGVLLATSTYVVRWWCF